MKLTDHKTLLMFARYNSVDEDDAKQALKMMDGYFEAKTRGTTAILLQQQKKAGKHLRSP